MLIQHVRPMEECEIKGNKKIQANNVLVKYVLMDALLRSLMPIMRPPTYLLVRGRLTSRRFHPRSLQVQVVSNPCRPGPLLPKHSHQRLLKPLRGLSRYIKYCTIIWERICMSIPPGPKIHHMQHLDMLHLRCFCRHHAVKNGFPLSRRLPRPE